MTADKVKECHDRIWAVREKIGLFSILIDWCFDDGEKNYYIEIKKQYKGRNSLGERSINQVGSRDFTTMSQVNQFLKELG